LSRIATLQCDVSGVSPSLTFGWSRWLKKRPSSKQRTYFPEWTSRYEYFRNCSRAGGERRSISDSSISMSNPEVKLQTTLPAGMNCRVNTPIP
jgi:hypothetical protein